MKTLGKQTWSLGGGFSLALFLAANLVLNTPAATSTNEDWNVATLDQILASVPPGVNFAQIGDLEISVAYLQGWRNKLAGGPQPKVAFSGTFTPWTSGNVYYAFDASVSASNQKAFLDATAEWAAFANLHFFPHTAQANYILVTNNASLSGGLSFVGMVGGAQLYQIGPGSWNRATLCHELGHALGLVHEHQRSDRDSFVTINTNNILSGHLADFVKLTDSQNKNSYDFLSVMHYSRNAFSVDPASNTIVPLPAYSQFLNVMGRRFDPVLSTSDRAGMIQVYGAGPGATNLVTNTLDSGPGSLRAALYYAFDHPGTTISFNIPVSDPGYSNNVFNILPSDGLTSLWGNTTLDGTTEPTNSNPAGPEIMLNGALCHSLSVYPNGLQFQGTNSLARGLVINNFPKFGVLIDGGNTVGNTVSGCYIGIDPTGTVAVTNGVCPVQISGGAVSNVVGGTTAAARNVIGGSVFQGLVIRDAGTKFNAVQGDYIGLNAAGAAALPNTWSGVEIFGGAQSNLIGGYTAAAGNVISGNSDQGVLIADAATGGNIVAGNFIGLNATGTAAVANGWSGVEIFGGSFGNLIGGTNAGAGNVISGNLNYGILTTSTNVSGTTIQGNYIGLNAAGTAAIGNSYAGIGVMNGSPANVIGGFASGAGNVISGNGDQGVILADPDSNGNLVAGNNVGVNPAGTIALGNGWSGVEVYNGAANNVVAANIISGNQNFGVLVSGNFNSVWGNYIGVNAAGTAALGNAYAGVEFDSTSVSNTLGGVVPAARNVISGNQNQGVVLVGSPVMSNVIQGNFIGLNAAGTTAISNTWSGIELYSGPAANTIGGYAGARNFISGNGNYGLSLNNGSRGNFVLGNTVGLNGANAALIPNTWAAVVMFSGAVSNVVGGLTPGAANLISGSTADGVQLFNANTTNNTIRGNSIFNNAGIAIALYGGNNNLAPPVLASAVVTTNTVVVGTNSGTAGALYQIDFYSDAPPAASAEAMTYLGAISVLGTGGPVVFNAKLGVRLPAGRAVTATATDPAGNTSPLSTGVAATMTSSVNDGVPDAWRAFYFGGSGTTTNSQSASFADPDHDGLSNSQEFLAGTNPTNAASALLLTAQNPFATTNAFSLNSANGIIYRVLFADTLTAGGWSILADQVVGTGTNIFFTDPAAAFLPRRFYRAEVLW